MVFDACYLTVTYSWYDSNPLARVVQASPVFSGGLDVKRNACSSAIKEWSVLTHVRHLSTIRGCVTNVCWLKGGNCIELLLNLVDQLSTAPCTFTFTKSNFTKHTLPVLHFEALQVSVQWPSHVPKLNSVKINCAAYLSMGSTTPPCDPKKLWLWMDFRKMFEGTNPFFPLDPGYQALWIVNVGQGHRAGVHLMEGYWTPGKAQHAAGPHLFHRSKGETT